MRICYVLSDLGIPLDGTKGAAAHVRSFVRALKSLGHHVAVVTSSKNGGAGNGVPVFRIPKPKFLANLSPHQHPRTFRAVSHLVNNVTTESILKVAVEEFQPEVIYERYSPFAAAASALAGQLGIPHILEVNAILSSEGRTYRKQALHEAIEFLEAEAFHRTSMIVTVSEVLRESIIAMGIPGEKVFTVPNGVDPMFFSDPVPSVETAPGENRTVIGFVGSLKPWHAIDLLVSGFRVLAKDPQYHLLIVGDGSTMKLIRELEKDLPGRVTVTGSIPHEAVPRHIDAMDIAVAPYPSLEQFYFSPLKVLEYMARGKAIVATGQGQIKDLICHGKTGWLIPPGDQQSLVSAIAYLAGSDALRKALGANAAREARMRHSWQSRVRSVLKHMRANGFVAPVRSREEPLPRERRAVYAGLREYLMDACNPDLGASLRG